MAEKKTDWGIPDWRDKSAYPTTKLDPQLWRWERNRRCDAYRKDWQRATVKPDSLAWVRWANARAKPGKYGMSMFLDPSLSAMELIARDPERFFMGLFLPGPTTQLRLQFVFYPFLPIGSQLAEAERHIKALRKQTGFKPQQRTQRKRAHVLYRQYLQALDARATDATFRAIGARILGIDAKEDYNHAGPRGKQLHAAAVKWLRDM
ncbi:MAG TPA: hypothetical protein VJ437_11175 [Acidiferrobacterales bacterium]|nr:hypothetical protein [Acidiferrobacterales bacterium]